MGKSVESNCLCVISLEQLDDAVKKGKTLKELSNEVELDYSQVKYQAKKLKHKHPDRFELLNNKFNYENGISLSDYLTRAIELKQSNRFICRTLKVDIKTLYSYCERLGIKVKGREEYKLEESSKHNIVTAMRLSIPERKTACIITYKGKAKTITEWARLSNINVSTLRRRIFELKWPLKEALEKSSSDYIPFFTSKALEAKDKAVKSNGNLLRNRVYEQNCNEILAAYNESPIGKLGKQSFNTDFP